jgi:hypothetical protein
METKWIPRKLECAIMTFADQDRYHPEAEDITDQQLEEWTRVYRYRSPVPSEFTDEE